MHVTARSKMEAESSTLTTPHHNMAAKKYIDLPLDISHVCHSRLCINADHLSHEPHDVNMDREGCQRLGRCTGHKLDGKQFAPCILQRCLEPTPNR